MAPQVFVLVGTRKGAFLFESDAARRFWALRGPFCETWPTNHVVADPASGTLYAGGGNEWFGPAVWKSTDLGASWTHSSQGLAYEAGQDPVKSVWSLAVAGDGTLYAGVEPAGLFRSTDGGESWTHLDGLQKHPTRPDWHPGGAGLILSGLGLALLSTIFLTPVAYLLLGRFVTPHVEEETRLKRELEEAAYANMEPAE